MKDSFQKRKTKVRARLKKVSQRLRLSVFRSHKHIYGQIIDDKKEETVVSACDQHLKEDLKKLSKIEISYKVGQLLAEKAGKKKIKKVYFDRGGYKYHGRVKALVEGARKGGLDF